MATPEPAGGQHPLGLRDVADERPPSRERPESSDPTMDDQSEDEAHAAHQRGRLAAIQRDIEIATAEEHLETLRRRRRAGNTPAASIEVDQDSQRGATPSTSTRSAGDAPVPPNRSGRLKLREPEPFKGMTLKEARDFVRTLELVFALAGDAYATDRERTLYGVMFLAGEPRENWHHMYSVADLEDYTWEDFKRFVYDAVEDPANRSLSVMLAYESARQGEHQSTHAFATELATLEEQLSAYTPEQRTRHLLAKLRHPLRTAIMTHHEVPTRRQDLISLATRLEAASKKDPAPSKRGASEAPGRSRDQKKPRPGGHDKANAPGAARPSQDDGGGVGGSGSERKFSCWNCGKEGHYQNQCTKPRKVSKVDEGGTQAKSKPKDRRDRRT
ncbi:hypothetical protein KC316_g11060 [Hortaea werneckii]|nr:hypothetical protein KC324_g10958 [Hortaea werneckii]KAI7575495.1 hypothetical protein KC316_g11060 [Hortaea werneckii]